MLFHPLFDDFPRVGECYLVLSSQVWLIRQFCCLVQNTSGRLFSRIHCSALLSRLVSFQNVVLCEYSHCVLSVDYTSWWVGQLFFFFYWAFGSKPICVSSFVDFAFEFHTAIDWLSEKNCLLLFETEQLVWFRSVMVSWLEVKFFVGEFCGRLGQS